MRHAKAVPYEPGADHERALAERGRVDAERVGDALGEAGAVPDLVLCSTATRTRETLECAAGAIGDATEVSFEPRIYGASVGELLSVIQAVGDEVNTLMLVGHNPGTQMLAVALAADGDQIEPLRVKFPTAGVADLRFEGAWADVAPMRCELAGFLDPRAFR